MTRVFTGDKAMCRKCIRLARDAFRERGREPAFVDTDAKFRSAMTVGKAI
jgi:hypothetical protein